VHAHGAPGCWSGAHSGAREHARVTWNIQRRGGGGLLRGPGPARFTHTSTPTPTHPCKHHGLTVRGVAGPRRCLVPGGPRAVAGAKALKRRPRVRRSVTEGVPSQHPCPCPGTRRIVRPGKLCKRGLSPTRAGGGGGACVCGGAYLGCIHSSCRARSRQPLGGHPVARTLAGPLGRGLLAPPCTYGWAGWSVHGG
jgi:hypothetical protein